jgi:alkylation response protein AidB-like acyl-CoA dehydrogenase
MALVLNEDQSFIQATAAEFCASKAPVSAFRALRDNPGPAGYDEDTWRAMVELGWSGITLPEAVGGTDFGWQAMGTILEQTGRYLAASPLLSSVVLGASALSLSENRALAEVVLPQVVDGTVRLALALEESPHHQPYGAALTATASGDAVQLKGEKRFVMDGGSAEQIIVVARESGAPGDRDGLGLYLVPREAGISAVAEKLADCRAYARLTIEATVPASQRLGGAELLDAVLDRGRAALAAEMLGAAQAAFDQTIAYLKERKQFGQVIGSFQALKHRAADLFGEIELARSTVLDALSALDEGRDDAALAVSLAKAKMGEVLHAVSCEALQMHGGIGMTDEFDIGFFMKRARVQEALLGNQAFHRSRYAALAGY